MNRLAVGAGPTHGGHSTVSNGTRPLLGPESDLNRFFRARRIAERVRRAAVLMITPYHEKLRREMRTRPFDIVVAMAVCDTLGYRQVIQKAVKCGGETKTAEDFLRLFSHKRSVPRFIAYYRLVRDAIMVTAD